MLGKTHIKKVFFLVVGSLMFYPSYTNGLVVDATFFFNIIIARNGFLKFFLFLPNFWTKTAGFKKKKYFFALWSGGGGYPPYTVSSPTTKKTIFNMCLPLGIQINVPMFVCIVNYFLYRWKFWGYRLDYFYKTKW